MAAVLVSIILLVMTWCYLRARARVVPFQPWAPFDQDELHREKYMPSTTAAGTSFDDGVGTQNGERPPRTSPLLPLQPPVATSLKDASLDGGTREQRGRSYTTTSTNTDESAPLELRGKRYATAATSTDESSLDGGTGVRRQNGDGLLSASPRPSSQPPVARILDQGAAANADPLEPSGKRYVTTSTGKAQARSDDGVDFGAEDGERLRQCAPHLAAHSRVEPPLDD